MAEAECCSDSEEEEYVPAAQDDGPATAGAHSRARGLDSKYCFTLMTVTRKSLHLHCQGKCRDSHTDLHPMYNDSQCGEYDGVKC